MNRTKYQRRNWRAIEAANKNKQRPVGVDMLSKAADQEVKHYSTEIAEAIRKEATEGNASAARLLVELAEDAEWVKDPATVERVLNIFEILARDQPAPQLDGEGERDRERQCEPSYEPDRPDELSGLEPMPGAIVAPNPVPPYAAYVN